jgi:hypothetical protein
MKVRRALVVSVASAAMVLVSLGPLPTAAAGEPAAVTSVRTPSGLSLTVTPMRLPSTGGTVRVRGAGFDPTVGIYVALCVTPRAGQQPGPCGGGVNTAGTSPASAWISSNPPPYGAALATPYRAGGRFSVRLTLSPLIGDIDCRTTSCSVVTRADHTRSADRRFDVAVPVRFAR